MKRRRTCGARRASSDDNPRSPVVPTASPAVDCRCARVGDAAATMPAEANATSTSCATAADVEEEDEDEEEDDEDVREKDAATRR